VAEFINIYETVVNSSALPVENSVLDLLRRSLTTSTSDPAYINLIDNLLPEATRIQLALFDAFNLDAMVFPYQSNFASPIRNPVYSVSDPTFQPYPGIPSPATIAGYASVGFPGIVVPMGFGSAGLPTAISFFGKPYDEGKLISYAYDYEQATLLRSPSPLTPPLPGETISVPEPGVVVGIGTIALASFRLKRKRSDGCGVR
jgi:amidase